MADGPDVVTAKRLLDHAKRRGFQFRPVECDPDGALLGTREGDEWLDTVFLAGFSRDCYALRQRTSSPARPRRRGATPRRRGFRLAQLRDDTMRGADLTDMAAADVDMSSVDLTVLVGWAAGPGGEITTPVYAILTKLRRANQGYEASWTRTSPPEGATRRPHLMYRKHLFSLAFIISSGGASRSHDSHGQNVVNG